MKSTDAKGFNGNVYQVTNPREVFDFNKFMKPGEINIFITNKMDIKGTEIFAANTIKEVFHANLGEEPQLKYLMIYDGVHTLLPKYGGKGMFGMNVHKAVIEAKEKESGITVHFVNEKYDEGKIIAQHICKIGENDTPEMLAQKIHQLEYEFFPKAIEDVTGKMG